ncbi:MAG TPA: hypothetical protein VN906_14580 [Candidatus Sulfotelmatobacter sp.]|nr:hypothetical protein [Candidatus Sulfotelmatobacter sp.]
MRRLALLAFLLVAACGSIGTAQAHTLALAYKTGDTYKYTLHAVFKYTLGAEGMSIPLDMDITAKDTITVKSVDSSGTADMTVSVSNLTMKMTMSGTTNTTTIPTSADVDMKIASDGRVVSINGSTLGSGGLPGLSGSEGGLISAVLPDGTVKPGDSWTKNYDQANPMGSGTIHIATKNKYVDDEKVGSVNTAKVQSNIVTTIDLTIDLSSLGGQSGGTSIIPSGGASGAQSITMKGTSTSDVTSWIDASAHRVVKTHSTGSLDAAMTMNMASGSTNPMLTGPITFKGTQTVDMTPA